MITHCGYNSLLEGVYFKVPMVCLPNNSDQPYNAYAAEERGYVVEVDFRGKKFEKELKKALKKVSSEDWRNKFKNNTEELEKEMNESKDKFIGSMKDMLNDQV
uniref:Glucuronosyltransferase n=1 Tax=Meloidogyne hapla TaxID=6305 RepID=A0A1I8AXK6_MELHA